MVIECITIILIILMISFIFLRSKRENYALVTLPLISVPLLHLVGQFINYFFIKEDQNAAVITNLSFDLLGLLIGALLLGLLVNNIPLKKAKISFVMISGIFLIALSIVLMTNLVV